MRVLSFRDICMPKLALLELPMRPEIALQGYSESVIDGQAFSTDLEKLLTLSANQSSGWIGLINVPPLFPSSRMTNWLNRGQICPTYIYFLSLTLNSKKNHDEAANSSSNELHMCRHATLFHLQ